MSVLPESFLTKIISGVYRFAFTELATGLYVSTKKLVHRRFVSKNILSFNFVSKAGHHRFGWPGNLYPLKALLIAYF